MCNNDLGLYKIIVVTNNILNSQIKTNYYYRILRNLIKINYYYKSHIL